jgi:DNA-directed RNA polymerase subunit RPC12/RpoP
MKKYKCIDCGKVFEAMDGAETCPQCGSDNITPVKGMSPAVKGLLLGMLCIPVGFGLALGIETFLDGPSKPIVQQEISTNTTVDDPIVPEGVILDIPQIDKVGELKLTKDGYSFEVSAHTDKRAALKYDLYTADASGASYTSYDGKFEKVAPTEDGNYQLVVTNVSDGSYVQKLLSGFVQPAEKPVDPLTKADLQKLLNNPSVLLTKTQRSKFAKGYKMTFVGRDPEEGDAPIDFQEVLNALDFNAWSRATIMEEPKYDEMNRITFLKIKVEY